MAERTEITRGVSYLAELAVTTPAGIPDNLTGFTFRAEVRMAGGSLVADLSARISLKAGATDKVLIALTDEQSWALTEGAFVWDVLADRPDGGVDIIIPTEPFLVITPATRPA
jgi:hypothetical protein